MTYASAADLDLAALVQAHSWNSQVPERRAAQVRDAYAAHVNELGAELGKLAETEAQRATLDAEMLDYAARYRSHLMAVMSARGRTASAMVTGPARFPTDRNRKALDTEQRRAVEMNEWDAKARKAMRAKLLAGRTVDQVDAALLARARLAMAREIGNVASIDSGEGALRGFDRSSFTNGAARMVKAYAKIGKHDIARALLDLVRQHQDPARPMWAARNPVWKLGEAAG